MKKLLPALLILLSIITSCQQQDETVTETPEPITTLPDSVTTDDEAVKVMQAMFDAFNRHDLEALQALYADSAIIMSPEMPEPAIGSHHVAAIYGSLFQMAPNVQDEVIHYIHKDGEIAVEFISSGTVENISPDDPAEMRGKQFEIKIFSRLKIKDGKIVEDISYFDQLSFLQQLGLAE